MWGEVESITAIEMHGQDVTGWLIQNSSGEFYLAEGVVETVVFGAGRYVVIKPKYSAALLLGASASIQVIKPAKPREVVKEVVREMTPEEVMRRAISIAEKMYHPRSSTFPWSHEKNAWLVAHSAICAAIEFSKEKSP